MGFPSCRVGTRPVAGAAGAAGVTAPTAAQLVEEWPYLEGEVLLRSRSRQVCMTCRWFRHHAGPDCIPLLTCQLHQGLIAHGAHLTSRCQGWAGELA